jgi:hypothetical protein
VDRFSVPEHLLATLLGAATFALIFAGPIRLVMKRRMAKVTFASVFVAVAVAIFVEYGMAAGGGGLIYKYTAHTSGNLMVAATLVLAMSGWTFLVGSWLLGWMLGAPSETRFEHGAVANALVLLCNGALVALAFGLDRILR